MGNHHIDCDFCGRDTRGLSGVKGCYSREEAARCGNYEKPSAPALASHPAGQSTGPGTGAIRVPDRLRTKILALCTIVKEGRRAFELADEIEECLRAAPSSPRMGQEGTEDEPVATVLWYDPEAHFGEKKPHKIIDASMAFLDAAEIGTKLYARPIAARPAAPEAQGAETPWKPISTAPRNDKLVMLGWWCDVGGDLRWIAVAGWYEAGPADQCWYSAYDEERIEPTHWCLLDRLPAPPASSGQGGR